MPRRAPRNQAELVDQASPRIRQIVEDMVNRGVSPRVAGGGSGGSGDIAAHAADPNAHHNWQHDIVSIVDHTIAAAQYSVVGATAPSTLGILATSPDGAANHNTILRSSGTGGLALDYLTAGRIDAAADLTIDPAGDVVFPDDQTLTTPGFDPSFPIANWQLEELSSGFSQLTIGGILADELRVRLVVSDETRVERGSEYWTRSYGILAADFSSPASVGASATLTVEDSPTLSGAVFGEGHWLALQKLDWATGIVLVNVWGQVYSYVDNGDGTQSWTFTVRKNVSGLSHTFKRGSIALDFGTSGDSLIHLSVVDPAGSPWIRFRRWATDPSDGANHTTFLQIGDLAGTPGNGDGLYVRSMADAGKFLLVDDDGLSMHNVDLEMYNGASQTVDLDSADGSFKLGTDVNDAAGRAIHFSGSTGILSIGGPSYPALVSVYGGINIREASNLESTGYLKIGPGIKDSTLSGWHLSTSEIVGQQLGVDQIVLNMDGELTAGPNDEVLINRAGISILVGDQTANRLDWRDDNDAIIASVSSNAILGSGYNYLFLAADGDVDENYSNITLTATPYNWPTGVHRGRMQLVSGVSSSLLVEVDNFVVFDSDGTERFRVSDTGMTLVGAVSGPEWEHDDNITIDAHSASPTTVYIVNDGGGVASLNVEGSITSGGNINGVNVAAHASRHEAAGADAVHHDLLLGYDSTEHVNHLAVDILAGDGLTGGGNIMATRTLHVGAGDGIDVAADAVSVDVTDIIGTGLNEDASNNLILPMPSNLTATTTNQRDGLGHAHAVIAASAPGATQSLLKTDTHGGIQLDTNLLYVDGQNNRVGIGATPIAPYILYVNGDVYLDDHLEAGSGDFNGALQVIDDDLTVYPNGSTPLFTVDVSQQNVGILCIPDPQFALDVNGPIRGTYLIGKHAIQLSDVSLLVHFDGPTPFETNYQGSYMGHMGQLPVPRGHTIYRPGKFGTKAIQIAESTTNYVTNPSFETNLSGWSFPGGPATAQSVDAYVGSYSLSITADIVPDPYAYRSDAPIALATGQEWTFSAYVKAGNAGAVGNTVSIHLRENSSSSHWSTTNATLTDEWQRITVTRTLTHATPTNLDRWVRMTAASGSNDVLLVDGVQLENRGYVTPYHDGSMTIPHSWGGTAHASTSARTTGGLAYEISNISAEEGSLGMWVYVEESISSSSQFLWYAGDATGEFDAYISSTGNLGMRQNGSGASTSFAAYEGQWTHLFWTWSAADNYFRCYVNGVLTLSTAFSAPTLHSQWLYIGRYSGGTVVLNGLIDDLVVGSVAYDADVADPATDAGLIKAIYESDAPVFAESAREMFLRVPTASPVWADDEGLWVRGTNEFAGDAIFGIYGGGATKSWGGRTMYQGDLMIGQVGDGYVYWHSGISTDDPDYAGDPTLEVVAELDVIGNSTISGILTAGAGKVILDPTGMTLVYDGGSGSHIRIKDGVNVTFDLYGATESSQTNAYLDIRPLSDVTGGNLVIRALNAAGVEQGRVSFQDDGGVNFSIGGTLVINKDVSLVHDVDLAAGAVLSAMGRISMDSTSDALVLTRVTTTQQNAMTPVEGMIIFNTTTQKFRGRTAGAWVDLH